MDLDANAVYEKLVDAGVDVLYHANTVRTSCTFLKEGKLLSRGTLDEQGLDQTSQWTDEKDMKLGLWYDVFLDTRDIHDQCCRRNQYGPVLFKISTAVLDQRWLPFVSITKSNPYEWSPDKPEEERFFSQGEFESSYDPCAPEGYKHMLVLRRAGGVVRLDPHFEEIIVDGTAPNWTLAGDESGSALSMSLGALQNASRSSGAVAVRENYRVRQCPTNCDCRNEYVQMTNAELNKHFAP